jgi:hypothetical protein
VMIHIKYATLTGWAVMASWLFSKLPLRLEAVTEETISTFAVLGLLCKEAPVDWYTSWVSNDRFKLTP